MSPTYSHRVGPNLTSLFYEEEKNSLIKNFFINLRFKMFALTMELPGNGKHFKCQIKPTFCDQTDF